MLKSFNELYAIDVKPFCDIKKGKDDRGREIDIPYLNWARCKVLLHENGAEKVYFEPIMTPDGSYLFESKTVQNKDRTTGCYFVRVKVVIDDLTFTQSIPLMNGTLVVYDETMNQLRINNAHARAFVKGVAIHTGLGFSLWVDDKDDENAEATTEDLSSQRADKLGEKMQKGISELMKRGYTLSDQAAMYNLKEKDMDMILTKYTKGMQYLDCAIENALRTAPKKI